jgi:threonine/homoserine/homoserine lactone efflux protein
LRSLLIGLSIAAPVGPIGILVIRRTLTEGRWQGLASGLGAATADAVYGTIAAFGLTALSSWLLGIAPALQLVGGGFLLYVGIQTLRAVPAEKPAETRPAAGGLGGAYLSTLLLTITNPMTILAFLGIFAGLGVANVGDNALASLVMVLGVFVGSALWWLLLSGGVSLLRSRFTPRWLLWVNRLSGVVILVFALSILAEVVFAAR